MPPVRNATSIRTFQLPLPHEVLLIDTLLVEDALVVLGSGMCEISLGLLFLATWLVQRQKRSIPLILILGLSSSESFQACIDRAKTMSVFKDLPFKFLGPDSDPKDRMLTMSRGGVYGSTSRTFVIDALSGRLPHSNIDGIMMFEAHKMINKPNDIFMVQLLREQRMSRGFCKAFTSHPVEMTKIFNHAERTMRALNVQRLLLAPRLAPRTSDVLNDENIKPMLEQRLLRLSKPCEKIQEMLLEMITKGIRELQRNNPGLPINITSTIGVQKSPSGGQKITTTTTTPSNSIPPSGLNDFYRNLERDLGDQIDPIWHKLSFHDRRIYKDIQVFRTSLKSLLNLDCVQFWLLLRNLKSSGFSTYDGIDSSWFLTSESDVLFASAKQRSYTVNKASVNLKLEHHPKLIEVNKIILRTLKEADQEQNNLQSKIDHDNSQMNHNYSQPTSDDHHLDPPSVHSPSPPSDKPQPVSDHHPPSSGSDHHPPSASNFNPNNVPILSQDLNSQVSNNNDLPSQSQDVPTTQEDIDYMSRPTIRILIVTETELFRQQIEDSTILGPEYPLVRSLRQATRTVSQERKDLEHSASFSEAEQIEEAYRQAIETIPTSLRSTHDLTSIESEEILEQLLVSSKVRHRPIIQTLAMNSAPADALERAIMVTVPHVVILTSLNVSWLRQCEMANARVFFSILDLCKRSQPEPRVEAVKSEPEPKRRRLSQPSARPPPSNPLMSLSNEELGLPDELTMDEKETIPGGPELKVFVLGFADSVENAEFTGQLTTEQQAWDHLIHARKSLLVFDKQSDLDALSTLTTPEERFRFMISAGREQSLGSSRKAGGGLAMVMQELRKRATQFHHEQVKQAIELGLPIPPAKNLHLERMSPAELLEMVKPSVLVDVREFRSSLPFQLWNAGVRVLPLTLPVADYVLAQDVGVERKSLSDLIQSLASGRLFRQCERLIRAFKVPTLLIEFDSSSRGYLRSLAKNPNLSPGEEVSKDKVAFQHSRFHIGNSRSSEGMEASVLVSKLAVLIMHFPSLKFVWSADCSFSTDSFFVLKEGRGQPDSVAVMKATCLEIGKKKPDLGADLDEIEPIDPPQPAAIISTSTARLSAQNAQNIVAVDLLQKVPGVTGRGLDRIVRRTKSLKELLMMKSEQLGDVMGREEASKLESCLDINLSDVY